MTKSSQDRADSELLSEAVSVLRELVLRARSAHDQSFDDGNTVDSWQSDSLSDAIERADAMIAKADAVIGNPDSHDANDESLVAPRV